MHLRVVTRADRFPKIYPDKKPCCTAAPQCCATQPSCCWGWFNPSQNLLPAVPARQKGWVALTRTRNTQSRANTRKKQPATVAPRTQPSAHLHLQRVTRACAGRAGQANSTQGRAIENTGVKAKRDRKISEKPTNQGTRQLKP